VGGGIEDARQSAEKRLRMRNVFRERERREENLLILEFKCCAENRSVVSAILHNTHAITVHAHEKPKNLSAQLKTTMFLDRVLW
jgi:hypothetical protein